MSSASLKFEQWVGTREAVSHRQFMSPPTFSSNLGEIFFFSTAVCGERIETIMTNGGRERIYNMD